ncbi:MAG TPA: hypothetical protein VI524_10260 [Anaerolineales bacterium]|nr:hypothetical protein [Anaerolineales bacterium]
MNKAVVLASIAALVLGACSLTIPIPPTGADANVTGTSDTTLDTAVAQTLTAQPMPTSIPPTGTPTTFVESSPAGAGSPTATFTVTADLTNTPATATAGAADPTSTATLAAVAGTSIPTLTIRLYGTLPPAVPFSNITLINKSKTEAYISLQVTSNDGRYAVLEYPVVGRVEVRAPLGSYLYVAWVGGNKMVGNFRLRGNEDLTMTLFRDTVVIK